MKPTTRKCKKNVSKNDVFGFGPNMCYINYNRPRSKYIDYLILNLYFNA